MKGTPGTAQADAQSDASERMVLLRNFDSLTAEQLMWLYHNSSNFKAFVERIAHGLVEQALWRK